MSPFLITLFLSVAGPCAGQVVGTFLFSNDQDETQQGHFVLEEEIREFDTAKAPGSEISGPLAGTGPSMFTSGEDINAFHRDSATGIYYLSTHGSATFSDNMLSIDRNDIASYDPGAAPGSRASLFFDPDPYTTAPRTVALSFHSDGDLLISFEADQIFAGLSVLNGDIVKFDPLDPVSTRSIFFSESLFTSGDEDIRGFHFESAGEMYLTVNGNAGLPGLPSFSSSDIVRWDGVTASIAVSGNEFDSFDAFNIDAIGAIPEPSGVLLLTVSAALALYRRPS